jgi:hypothetical protein
MNLKLNEVYTFKLNSGEELIAKVIKVDGNDLVIKEPVSVAPGPQGMGLMPSMFTADPDAETRLNTSAVSIYALTDDSVKAKYIQATSGLIVPETKKIIMG